MDDSEEWPGLDAPVVECEEMQRVRVSARRLAQARLPVVITGEVGAGRRTLAQALARARAGEGHSGPLQVLFGPDGLPPMPEGPAHVVVVDVDSMPANSELALRHLVTSDHIRFYGTGLAVGSNLKVLGVEELRLPPLRERPEAELWARYFLESARPTGAAPVQLAARTIEAIRHCRWPGNLTQLRAAVERAAIFVDDGEITEADLGLPEVGERPAAFKPMKEALEDFRREYVLKAVAHFGGNRTRAARALGVDARTVFRYLAD